MAYLIAIILPCVGAWIVGRWGLGIVLLLLMLTGFGWLVASLVAFMAVREHYDNRRFDKLYKLQRGQK